MPKGVTQDDEAVLAGPVVAGIEGSAEKGSYPEHLEELGGDDGGGKTQRFAVAIEVEFVAFVVGSDIEGFDLIAEGYESAPGIVAGKADEILRLRERQGAKKDVVDEAKNGGIGADAKSESERRDQSEGRGFAKDAESVAEVLKESFEKGEGALIADALFGLFEAAEGEKGLTAGFAGRETAAEIVVDVELEVRGEFGVQLRFERAGTSEEIAETGEESAEHGHIGWFLWDNKRRIEQFVWESNREKRKRRTV